MVKSVDIQSVLTTMTRLRLQEWIRVKLTLANIDDIDSVYHDTVQEVIQIAENESKQSDSDLDAVVLQKFRRQMTLRLEKEVKPIIMQISDVLKIFVYVTNKKFKEKIFFPDSDVEHMIQNEIQEVVRSQDATALKLPLVGRFIPRACKVLGVQFQKHNSRVIEDNKAILSECIESIKSRHNQDLQLLIANGPHSIQIIQEYHESVRNHYKCSSPRFRNAI